MRNRTHKIDFSGIGKFLAIIVVLFLILKLLLISFPYIKAITAKIAVVAAGISMPEGGKDILLQAMKNEKEESLNNNIKPTPEPEQNKEPQEEVKAPIEMPEIPIEFQGPLVREFFGAGSTTNFIKYAKNSFIKNVTSIPNQTVIEYASQKPEFKITKNKEPQVLIMHTHATESYEPFTRDIYDNRYNSRTTDNEQNVTKVGEVIAKELEAAGISYIQDKTHHDYPSYNGSYDRSEVTVKQYLEQYPSIKIVLDVHRDAIQRSDGTRVAPVTEINGKNAAQIMIISGCDDGTMGYPNYAQNLRFASMLQQQMDSDYYGLARPMLFDYRKYNQHLTTGSILLEMGANGNSFEEAIYSGQLLGKSLVKVLENLQ